MLVQFWPLALQGIAPVTWAPPLGAFQIDASYLSMQTPPTRIMSSLGSRVGQASIALTMKPAICARVTELPGQYLVAVQPPVIPRRASSSMNGQNGLLAGTSVNISWPGTQAGGWGRFRASARVSAISSRVVPFWANTLENVPKLT